MSIITLHILDLMLYCYKIGEGHKHTLSDLTKDSQLAIGMGLGRVDITKGSEMYSDTRDLKVVGNIKGNSLRSYIYYPKLEKDTKYPLKRSCIHNEMLFST